MNKHTRLIFGLVSVVLTTIVLLTGVLSDGAQVAAYAFLGTVATGFGIAKFAEHWKKPNE